MNVSGCFKFILGFLLAIAILAGGSVLAALYFAARLSGRPPKPTFANDQAAKTKVAQTSPSPKTPATSSPAPAPSPSPSPSPAPSPPPNSQPALVTWPQGLILRGAPSYEADRIGGIPYEGKVYIIKKSADGVWEKVWVPEDNQRGWVKAGNTRETSQ
ncbi:SH3 domain-containing protein [Geitlerinema sp. PCC 9228]|jgi:hypothetical protein|uniref:SH3 domain-containing protein n=1 Tax=Geitlerinema sp. PCC 9228 TaxID=111611 RepID=UPI0008F99228|nr:SH3 domain-containing protein [Geitlerinema sp. PCC 9228]